MTEPTEVLDQARAAFNSRDFATALERYEYFFDHALDDDPDAMYGVRLSFCIDEWYQLGQLHPPAMARLGEKADEALVALEDTRDPERFQDYVSICVLLKRGDEPVQRFLDFHTADPDLAKQIVRFVWDELVADRRWSVCADYVTDSQDQYDAALLRLDQTMRVCKNDPELGGAELEAQIEDWYIRDVANLILVLRHAGRGTEAAAIENCAVTDTRGRNVPELMERIRELLAGE
jgi:hypothetical protein